MGGKKKAKELEAPLASPSQNDIVASTPSNIFKTLFGDQNDALTVSSIFSDGNPFKRKANEKSDSLVEEKEVATEIPKKLKAPKNSESNPNSSLQIESSETGNEKKKKKKRKRDEIESEYEAKKYNVSVSINNVSVGEKRKKSENSEEDMLVSEQVEEEGFDDESKLLRTIFVGNLPLKMKKKTLIKEFSQFGEIDTVRIRSVPIANTKIPRKGAVILKKINDSADSVHAYIVFKTEQSAEASLVHNMVVFGGNHIRVDRACPPRKKLKGEATPLYDSKRTLFVGNLPFDVKDEEIYQLFSQIKDLESSIEAVRVIRDTHLGLGKGIAYVLFKTREAANLALKKRNLKIRDRELRVSHAKKDSTTSTPAKRRNPFPAETAGTPTKKLSVDSRTPERNSRSNTKASPSYQGLRASKTGAQKKLHPKHNGVGKTKSNNPTGEMRHGKRPAVAARKARGIAKDGSATKQTGQKRKLNSQTPQSSDTKKAKRFRK